MGIRPIPPSLGTKVEDIDVRLSHKIVELFSEGLYTSPNKALEELVTNSFDAGATRVHVLIPPDFKSLKPDDMIVVIDDGEGMGPKELKKHWLIGTSDKRTLKNLPRGRRQIGKFGIGKLATYVLAGSLTHISKRNNKYLSTSLDYGLIDETDDLDVVPNNPITTDMVELTAEEAKVVVNRWSDSPEFKKGSMPLFGKNSPKSWTVTIMSDLKSKASDIRDGRLRWILRTSLPLRPDFSIWLAGEKLSPSRTERGRIKRWTIGKEIVELQKPAPKDIVKNTKREPSSSEHKFGLNVPAIGRVTGHVEVYRDPLTRPTDDERGNGFFVYARGRLINVTDGHFGISPNKLRHGTFSRFRAVVHVDELDGELRSNREAVGDGHVVNVTRNLLQAIFNYARNCLEMYDNQEGPGARLAQRLAVSRASLSRTPIVLLARSVAQGTATARHLVVPTHTSSTEREKFFSELDDRAKQPSTFVTGTEIDHASALDGPIAKFYTESGVLKLNGSHQFVARFYEEFVDKRSREPLESLAMGEVLIEAHLHFMGVDVEKIDEFLLERDQFLRAVADSSERKSPASIANSLWKAREPAELEKSVCDAFSSLGFEVTPFGQSNQPDGVAEALLLEMDSYKVALEAKSTKDPKSKLPASKANISAVIRHMQNKGCTYAAIVAQDFQASTEEDSAFRQSIMNAKPLKITLISTPVLAKLVRLRHTKQIVLKKIRELFDDCLSPEESKKWVDSLEDIQIQLPPYIQIIKALARQVEQFSDTATTYPALRVELANQNPPIKYTHLAELKELCKAIAHVSQGTIWATPNKVVLEQSQDNAIAAVETSLRECADVQ